MDGDALPSPLQAGDNAVEGARNHARAPRNTGVEHAHATVETTVETAHATVETAGAVGRRLLAEAEQYALNACTAAAADAAEQRRRALHEAEDATHRILSRVVELRQEAQREWEVAAAATAQAESDAARVRAAVDERVAVLVEQAQAEQQAGTDTLVAAEHEAQEILARAEARASRLIEAAWQTMDDAIAAEVPAGSPVGHAGLPEVSAPR